MNSRAPQQQKQIIPNTAVTVLVYLTISTTINSNYSPIRPDTFVEILYSIAYGSPEGQLICVIVRNIPARF